MYKRQVQHRADRNAEEHAHDAECLAANRNRHQNEQARKTDGFADKNLPFVIVDQQILKLKLT